ncbi:MAG: hypothetical protein AAF721_09940 [Myxococcota bacterium]
MNQGRVWGALLVAAAASGCSTPTSTATNAGAATEGGTDNPGDGGAPDGGDAPTGGTGGVDDTGAGGVGGGDDQGPGHDFPPAGPPGGTECPELSCLPCGNGRGCAEGRDPIVDGTCCAEGDALLHVGQSGGHEIVGLSARSDLLISCGGFGASIEDISDPEFPAVLGVATPRCQHGVAGPTLSDGTRIVYLAHHGDTWVDLPFLATYTVDPDGTLLEAQLEENPDILFEGLDWSDDGYLYVAAHGGGLRVYRTDPDSGLPTFETTIGGFDNASRVTVDGAWIYVGDGTGGLKILSRADPAAPNHVATVDITGIVRDVALADGRAYLAAGSDGVFVLDVADPSAPMDAGHIEVRGAAQAVDTDGDIVAVAAWSHAAVYDAETFQLLATEHVNASPSFEQDTSIALVGEHIYVGEWKNAHVLRYQPGLVGPDIWVDEELVSFPANEPKSRAVVVRNLGFLDLDIDTIDSSDPARFTADASYLRVPPLSGRAFEIAYEPQPGVAGPATMAMSSNEPDEWQEPLNLPLDARDGAAVNVGDPIDERWAFLDPSQSPDLSGLEGHVIVLAYFALF